MQLKGHPLLSWGWQGTGGLVPYAVPASGALCSPASEISGIATPPSQETAFEYCRKFFFFEDYLLGLGCGNSDT